MDLGLKANVEPFSALSALSSCSNLTCQKFSLPMAFSNGSVDIDLGRNARLMKVDVFMNSVVAPPNVTVNLSLSISSGNARKLLCVRNSITGLNASFECQGQTGRYLKLTLAVAINANTSASNLTGNA